MLKFQNISNGNLKIHVIMSIHGILSFGPPRENLGSVLAQMGLLVTGFESVENLTPTSRILYSNVKNGKKKKDMFPCLVNYQMHNRIWQYYIFETKDLFDLASYLLKI